MIQILMGTFKIEKEVVVTTLELKMKQYAMV